jgi:hypothetical protein
MFSSVNTENWYKKHFLSNNMECTVVPIYQHYQLIRAHVLSTRGLAHNGSNNMECTVVPIYQHYQLIRTHVLSTRGLAHNGSDSSFLAAVLSVLIVV